MNHHIRRGYTMLARAVQLALANPVDNDLATSLLAELQLRVAGIEQTLGLQRHGHAAMLGAAENRQDHANALRETMRDLARIARVLDPRDYPDIACQMRTANLKVYSELLARAQCFIDAARPIKEVFIAYGAPADFLTRLESQISAVNAAERRKFNGQGERINATATLTEQTREAIRTLRKLQVIHANYYRSQPGLAAAWKAATHIERASKAKGEIPDTAPNSVGAETLGVMGSQSMSKALLINAQPGQAADHPVCTQDGSQTPSYANASSQLEKSQLPR